MGEEYSPELLAVMNGDELDSVKSELGIEVILNHLLPGELIENGYRKMDINEVTYLEPLFKVAPQLVTEKLKTASMQKAFKEATKDSYKCILDKTKHLATIRGTADEYIGTALDNKTNQIAGQARWSKCDSKLTVSNVSDIALNAFNALSFVTGQYFMSQINSNLIEINSGIQGIQKYLENKEESELKTALHELEDILTHLQFIKNSSDRINTTIIQLDGIRKTSRDAINLNKKQILDCRNQASTSDNQTIINANINSIRKHVVQYRFAVHIYNVAHILKIYLSNITDREELQLYRDELETTIQQYKDTFHTAIEWLDEYIDETNALNKAGKMQVMLSLGSRCAGTFYGFKYGTLKLGSRASSLVDVLFEENRRKKKNGITLSQGEYKEDMSNMKMIESSLAAMDSYIESSHRPVELISFEEDYYIKYIEKV